MIHSLVLKDWPKHTDVSFEFGTGIISISGPNESGKSLILEAINFALRGVSALRLPAKSYGFKLNTLLEFSVNGKRYTIRRNLKEAELTGPDELQVVGVTPVNTYITKLFGYSQKVFEVANMCKQDDVLALQSMGANERKRVINNLIGLSPVEATMAEYKAELKTHKAELKGIQAWQPVEVPEAVDVDPSVLVKLQGLQKLHHQLSGLRMVEPEVYPQPVQDLTEAVDLHTKYREALNHQKARKALIESKPPEVVGTIVDLEDLRAEWAAHRAFEHDEQLKASGSLNCSACGTTNYFHAMHIKDVPFAPKPTKTIESVEAANRAILQAQDLLVRYEAAVAAMPDRSAEFLALHTKVTAMGALADLQTAWNKYNQSIFAKDAYIAEQAKKLELQAQIGDMGLDAVEAGITEYHNAKARYVAFTNYTTAVTSWESKVRVANEAIKDLERIITGLTTLHSTIKSNLLPSLNKMASSLVVSMTAGEHTSVGLDEDMNIFVDKTTPVEALSGSGKAVSLLALRLALGSILTSRVFPVVLFDEIDAGMDIARSGNVMSLLSTMSEQFSQVFIISHKTLETVDQAIILSGV